MTDVFKYIGILLVFSFFIWTCSGCSREYKCVDGDVYVSFDGAWIEDGLFQENKCQPRDTEGGR